MSAWISGTTSMPCGTSALTSCCAMGIEGCRSLDGLLICSHEQQRSWLRSGMHARRMFQCMVGQSLSSLPGCGDELNMQHGHQLAGFVQAIMLGHRGQRSHHLGQGWVPGPGPGGLQAGMVRLAVDTQANPWCGSAYCIHCRIAAACLEHETFVQAASNLTHFPGQTTTNHSTRHTA
jgi:hypothetical protein